MIRYSLNKKDTRKCHRCGKKAIWIVCMAWLGWSFCRECYLEWLEEKPECNVLDGGPFKGGFFHNVSEGG